MEPTYIVPSSPNLLIDRYGAQSAAPANIAMINHLQDQISNAAPYTVIGATLNHLVGQIPTITIIGATASRDCPDDCGGQRNCTCFTISNFATGKYMITLSSAPSNGFNVLVAPLADARQNLGIEIVGPTQVVVSTYDIVGAAYIDNAFKNKYIQCMYVFFLLWN